MFTVSRRFRLKDLRLALQPDAPALDFRFHEPFDASGAFVAPGPEGPRFIRVLIFPSERAPNESGSPSTDAILESAVNTNLPLEVFSYFQSIAEGRFPERVPVSPEVERVLGPIKPGDPIPADYEVSYLWMPKDVAAFVDDLQRKVIDYARRVGALFRWTTTAAHYVDGRVYPPLLSTAMWSLNGSAPRPILPAVQMSINLMAPPVAPADVANQAIQQLAQLGRSAPVADEIIREAWALRETNPRAAVVLAIAAAEAGFRRLVSDLVPDARYLVEEMQMPPLVKLVKNYLPKLPLRSNPHLDILPPALRGQLDDAVNLRNKIVHRGTEAPNEKAVEDSLAVASDLVRLFDYYAGNQWALSFVSKEVRQGARSTKLPTPDG